MVIINHQFVDFASVMKDHRGNGDRCPLMNIMATCGGQDFLYTNLRLKNF